MFGFFRHIFFPHHSNNQRARLIHSDSILMVSLILFLATFFLSLVINFHSSVLGSSVNISTQELLLLTNQERQKAGIFPLVYNDQLASAAKGKADDMFKDNYWAHISPVTGKTPWIFIQKSGYQYVYAGENLARGYSTAPDVMQAWMNSPTHRANILSQNYHDVGFAIEQGILTGEKDTVLIVEMFGGKGTPPLSGENTNQGGSPITSNVLAEGLSNGISPQSIVSTPLIDRYSFAKNTTQWLILIFVILFVLDLIIIEGKKISRLVGHNIDHILFLLGILFVIIMLTKGSIY